MMLNLLGAAAFLSSSPMVGDARGGGAWLLKEMSQGEEFTVLAAARRSTNWLAEPLGC